MKDGFGALILARDKDGKVKEFKLGFLKDNKLNGYGKHYFTDENGVHIFSGYFNDDKLSGLGIKSSKINEQFEIVEYGFYNEGSFMSFDEFMTKSYKSYFKDAYEYIAGSAFHNGEFYSLDRDNLYQTGWGIICNEEHTHLNAANYKKMERIEGFQVLVNPDGVNYYFIATSGNAMRIEDLLDDNDFIPEKDYIDEEIRFIDLFGRSEIIGELEEEFAFLGRIPPLPRIAHTAYFKVYDEDDDFSVDIVFSKNYQEYVLKEIEEFKSHLIKIGFVNDKLSFISKKTGLHIRIEESSNHINLLYFVI